MGSPDNLRDRKEISMKTLSDVLRAKGSDVFVIQPTDSVHDAMALMNDKGVGALLVTSSEGVAGILSERDVARKITLTGKNARETPASEVMTERVTCVEPELNIRDAMQLMTDRRVRHLPIVKDRQLVGVVSIGDLVKAVIDDQQFTIEQLQHYIVS
jgi:CBS domain-containing protein